MSLEMSTPTVWGRTCTIYLQPVSGAPVQSILEPAEGLGALARTAGSKRTGQDESVVGRIRYPTDYPVSSHGQPASQILPIILDLSGGRTRLEPWTR